MLKDINYKIADKNFYYRNISDYRDLGLVQLALNEWRKDFPSDIQTLAAYEDKITTWLLESKKNDEFDIDDKKDVDSFVVKIMAEKFNDRYGSNLCQEQKSLLRKYVFSGGSDSVREEVETMVEVAKQSLSNYSTERQQSLGNQHYATEWWLLPKSGLAVFGSTPTRLHSSLCSLSYAPSNPLGP